MEKTELEKAKEAARIIRDYCEKQDSCNACPFLATADLVYPECVFKRMPLAWDINYIRQGARHG